LAACENSIFTFVWLRRVLSSPKTVLFFRLVFWFTCLGSPSSYWAFDIPSTNM
jgi:hypothetical protein